MNARPYGIVAHEAAHVVVGVALGLRLHSAVVKRWHAETLPCDGWVWFPRGSREALALMYAAGIAWDRAVRSSQRSHVADAALLREIVGLSRSSYEACVTAAGAILESRALAQARVIRALLEHDLTHEDVERLARGVSPTRLREDEA